MFYTNVKKDILLCMVPSYGLVVERFANYKYNYMY